MVLFLRQKRLISVVTPRMLAFALLYCSIVIYLSLRILSTVDIGTIDGRKNLFLIPLVIGLIVALFCVHLDNKSSPDRVKGGWPLVLAVYTFPVIVLGTIALGY